MTFGLAAIVALLYWLGMYTGAFWVITLAIAENVIAVARAIIFPEWYFAGAMMAGVDPDETRLFIVKGVILAVLVPVAWHLGTLAGYF